MKIAPLKGSFMVMSIIGFFVSVLLIYPASNSFGVAFGIVFIAMFISSLISMTYAPIEEATPRDLDRGSVMHVGSKPKKRTVAKRKALKKKAPAKKKSVKKKPVKKKSAKKTKKTAKKKSSKKRR